MALYAQVLLINPAAEDANGNLIVLAAGLEWQDAEWLDLWDCEHVETMCADCVDTWNEDYEIVLPEGIDE
jgi:hypothetical protein